MWIEVQSRLHSLQLRIILSINIQQKLKKNKYKLNNETLFLFYFVKRILVRLPSQLQATLMSYLICH